MKRERAMLAVVLALGLSGAAWAQRDRGHDANAKNQKSEWRNNDRQDRGAVARGRDDNRGVGRDDHSFAGRDDHSFVGRDDHSWADRDNRVQPYYGQPYYGQPVFRGDGDRDDRYRPGIVTYGYTGGNYANLASENGYRDGLRDGANDFRTGHSFRPTQDLSYREGGSGWVSALGDRNFYDQSYRDAYLQGYRQGYRG